VTKSATPQSIDYLYAQAGSWNSYRVEGQISGALDAEGRVRAIGVAVRDQGDSFMNELYHKKTTLYAGVNVTLTDSVSAYLHGGYERVERPSFDGYLAEPDGSAPPVPRSLFVGSKHIVQATSVYHAEGDLTWHAAEMLEFSLKGNYESTKITGALDYAYGLQTNGDVSIDLAKFVNDRDKNYAIGVSSIYRFDTLGLKNSFMSLAALYQKSRNPTDTLVSDPGTTNIFSGQAAISQAFDSLLTGAFTPFSQNVEASTLTVSAQSVWQLIDPLTLLLGVSYSKPDVSTVVNGLVQDFNIGGQVSYRAGLTYEFLPRTTSYVSYSQSFAPQGYLAINYAPLPPLTGDQYEGGLKYRSANGRLLLTGAVYQIKERNVAQFVQPSPNGDLYAPVGRVTNKGIELQALGQITRQWQVNAGYAYLNPKVTADTDPAVVGQTQLFLPSQTLSLFTTYTLRDGALRGLTFGGGARYVSNEQTSYRSQAANAAKFLSPSKDLPGYTLVDATLSYSLDKWIVQLNARNVFDRHYFINSWQTLFYGNFPGDPTSVAVSVRRTF
jgi:iron complex outermembrane receptor protein